MISFNTPSISQQSNTGIFINRHLTVQAAAEATGYNIQYLRRLLRSGMLKGIKIGQGIPNGTLTSALAISFLHLFDGLDSTPRYGGIHGYSQ